VPQLAQFLARLGGRASSSGGVATYH
jgi:hypothetical protein